MKKEKQTIYKQATYWLGVIIIGLTVGLGIQFTQAWVNPGNNPPKGNVAGPITTGSVAQYKTGPLSVNIDWSTTGYSFVVGGTKNVWLGAGATYLANGKALFQAIDTPELRGAALSLYGNNIVPIRIGSDNGQFRVMDKDWQTMFTIGQAGYVNIKKNVLDMNANRIVEVGAPIAAQDAATKAYVDAKKAINLQFVSADSPVGGGASGTSVTALCPSGTRVISGGGACGAGIDLHFLWESRPADGGTGWLVVCGIDRGTVQAHAYAYCF